MIVCSPAVHHAISLGQPVVGLETSVLAQGLPDPHNRAAALAMPFAVRAAGATPAFVAIDRGSVVVGADESVLNRLMAGCRKVGRRDLAIAAAFGEDGATTVGATIWACARVGIRVVATGGIGGVHRGAAHSFDISEDLAALASLPVVLVCSGGKAILDLSATLERLETEGVPVLGFQTDEFPAFFSSDSGLPVQRRVESVDEVARIVESSRRLGLSSAILVCVPPPADAAIPAVDLADVLEVAEAETTRFRGAARTPALLAALGRLTNGRTIRTNLALLEQNARVAAEIARAISELNPPQDVNQLGGV